MAERKSWRDSQTSINEFYGCSLGSLCDSWRVHIQRFVNERDKSLDDRTVWGAYDFEAALHIRSAFERGLAQLSEAERTEAQAAIDVVDMAFSELTAPDSDSLLEKFLELPLGGRGWWWSRIPTRGPVREELGKVQ